MLFCLHCFVLSCTQAVLYLFTHLEKNDFFFTRVVKITPDGRFSLRGSISVQLNIIIGFGSYITGKDKR